MLAFNGSAAALSALVTPAWLAKRLSAVSVIDASWYLSSSSGNARADFQAARIPGARFMDIDAPDMCDATSSLPHMLPDVSSFSRAAHSQLGLRRGKPAVIYSKAPFFASARAWWMLRAFGKHDVYVLNGGLPAWQAAGHPTVSASAEDAPTSGRDADGTGGDVGPLDLQLDPGLVRSFDDVVTQVRGGEGTVLDARSAARFEGRASEPRNGLRGGHMPGAINIPGSSLVAEDGTLLSNDDLRNVFESAGVDFAQVKYPVTATCGSGVTAAIVALALFELGVARAAVYDGSWSEYGSREDGPVVTT